MKQTLKILNKIKKPLVLTLIIGAAIAGFLSLKGTMPFMAILGTSMEPELHAGNLILIEDLPPSEVEVGDVIVFTVPPVIQDAYGYPPIVAHRVIKVNTEVGISFRTKGDNTGEDPFTTRAQSLKGTVSKQIPYAGFPLLFAQSRQGLIFIITALSLLVLYLYSDELGRGRQTVHRGVFAPVIAANQQSSLAITRKIEGTEDRIGSAEKRMELTQQALEKFAGAIELYAEHLKSHTSAIQGLSEASHELKKGAAEQNRVLSYLLQAAEQGKLSTEGIAPKSESTIPGHPVKSTGEQAAPEQPPEVTEPKKHEDDKPNVPGCYLSRRHQDKKAEDKTS